jgi:broad specificity phosphatase PhoE
MTIYLVRHAQSTFNAVYDKTKSDPMIFDPPLTALGEMQVKQAQAEISQLDISQVIVSPLTRALQTADLMFGDTLPFHICPEVRERLFHSCDVGRAPSELATIFPHHDFAHLDTCWWHDGEIVSGGISVEPYEFFQRRADQFVEFLKRERVQSTAVVTHGWFIHSLTGSHIKNCEVLEYKSN